MSLLIKYYIFVKKYTKNNNSILISFSLLFPTLTATFSVEAAFYMAGIICLVIIFSRVSLVLFFKFFPRHIAFNFSLIVSATYATCLFLISSAIYPNQMRIIIIPFSFLLTNAILVTKFKNYKEQDTIFSCILDAFLYVLLVTIFIAIIAFFRIFNFFNNSLSFSILSIAMIVFLLNFIRLEFESYIEKRTKRS